MDLTAATAAEPSADARPARRMLVARTLGTIGGLGTVGGMWLPLASVAGLGNVGSFDYSHPRAYACIAAAAAAAVFSLSRCFRWTLLSGGLLCGILLATGLDLFQSLRDALSMGSGGGQSSGELAQMARQMIAHSSLKAGFFILPICGVCCVVAGFLGSTSLRSPLPPRSTSES